MIRNRTDRTDGTSLTRLSSRVKLNYESNIVDIHKCESSSTCRSKRLTTVSSGKYRKVGTS